MNKFKFINENQGMFDDVSTTTKEFQSESLYVVLAEFETFLRGCGFVFNGQLDFVEDDEEDFGVEDDVDWSLMNQQSSLLDDTITIVGSSKK